jgi:hypothetical protein
VLPFAPRSPIAHRVSCRAAKMDSRPMMRPG